MSTPKLMWSYRVDTNLTLKYYYHNNYERISLMFVFLTETTYVTTTTMRTKTAHGLIDVYSISDYRK